MITYFVTGGAGFIGSNFIRYMFQKYGDKIKIINVDFLTYAGNLRNLDDINSTYFKIGNYIFEKADICDTEKVEQLFQIYHPDYVINFAAESHVDRSIANSHIFLKTNVLGTQVLLENARKYGVKRFHQISTDEVYGSLGKDGYFTEKSPLAPRSPYSASKASADLLCQSYYETYHVPITISRCSNNYGPYQFPEKLIPLIIGNILEGKPLPIYGNGLNVRDWLHVEDHSSAVDCIVHQAKDGEIYNIGGNNEWSNIELVKLLIENVVKLTNQSLSEIEKLITYVEDRKGHDFRYAIDNSKLKRGLNWKPETLFHKGVIDTIKWYLNNTVWINQCRLREL